MNYKIVLRMQGRILIITAAAMTPSLLISFLYDDGAQLSFILSIAIILAVGIAFALSFRQKDSVMRPREGFIIVALSWVLLSLFGALPAFISGAIPNYIDALFENTAGFSTTGATILSTIENVPEGIVFWRTFTQWLGGMGVLILTIAILPAGDRGAQNLMWAELPGPSSERIVPRVRKSVIILYSIYVALTLIQAVMLLFGGMSLYEALIHALATAGTGGFSSRDLNIGAFNSDYIEYVVSVFMLLFAINYSLYYAIIARRFIRLRKSTELKVFFMIIVVSSALIALNLMMNNYYDSVETTVRHSVFHVISMSSSTGYSTVDYNLWPEFSRIMLMILMSVGACAGSTGGGLKVIRVTILFKSAVRELKKIIHPRSVNIVHIDGQPVQDKTLTGILHYFIVYVLILIVAILFVSLDNMGTETTITSVIAMISNLGPGFGAVGPRFNYSGYSYLSKIVLSVTMLVGRLEIYPILMLVMPSSWKKT